MDSSVFVTAVPVFVIASLAMPAGIGGGLLYVPVMLLLGTAETPNSAAALSQPIVVGAALAANIFNFLWQRRHPSEQLIKPELVLSAISPCLAGAIIGSLLNQMLPQAVIIVLLVFVIVWSFQSSLRKAISLWKKESEQNQSQSQSQRHLPQAPVASNVGMPLDSQQASSVAQDPTATPTDLGEEPDTPYSTGSFNVHFHDQGVAQSISQADGLRRRAPSTMENGSAGVAPTQDAADSTSQPASSSGSIMVWLQLLAMWSLLIIAIVLRGGKGTSSLAGIAMCSSEYWMTSGIIVCVLILCGLLLRRPEISFLASLAVGVLSAIVGIGGGLILNPMFMASGLDATKTTATTGVMILMTCSSAATSLALAGAVPLWPMVVLSLAAFLGSLSGKAIIGWVVSKTGRTSILVFLLAAFMLVSGLLVITQGGIRMASEIAEGRNPFADFKDPCD